MRNPEQKMFLSVITQAITDAAYKGQDRYDIYKTAVDELFEAEVKSNTLDNKRDKEALIIDLFRTLEASRRKNNI